MECKQCKLVIPKSSRSKVIIGYCRHCAGSIGYDWRVAEKCRLKK